jgi:hypothetical protein
MGSALALLGVFPLVKARSGDRGRRVRSALCVRADAEAANTDGGPYAGLRQVQPEWSQFDALAESPCHTLQDYQLRDADPEPRCNIGHAR